MDCQIEIPAVKRIICSSTRPGEPWQEGEFSASSHPRKREILIALQGECRYMMNNSVYSFVPGTIGLISPGTIHARAYTASDHDLLHLWLHFSGPNAMYGIVLRIGEAGKYSRFDFQNNPVYFPDCLGQLLLRRWTALEQCGCGDEKTVSELMQLPCQLLLNELSLQWSGMMPIRHRTSLSSFLRSYIRSHIGNDCSLCRLAEITGFSQSHLSHVFMKETGESIGTFINSVRIAYTADALRHGVRQKIIAEELGFASPRAFWNWMQKFPELKRYKLQD